MTHSRIVLCGFMSSGKTTIGKPLAKELGYRFIDTDELLIKTYGMSIPEMFAKGGESYFRDLEHEIAKQVSELEKVVISTGGGMMTYERNAKVLSEKGTIIYIDQDFETCYQRLSQNPERPLVKNNTKEQLYEKYCSRIPSYQKYASYILNNPGSVEDSVQSIMDYLNR